MRLDTSRRRDAVCYLPQHTVTDAVLTVYESVLLARKQGASWAVADEDLAAVDGSLAALGIQDLGFRGLDELSGGQRQIVGIAQTLVREPEIVLMDEPTSTLDLHRQLEVLSFMRRLAVARGMVVLMALHDLNHALRFANQTMVIANGRLQACGPSLAVITAALLREVWGVRARIEPCSHGQRHVIVDGAAPLLADDLHR